MLPQSPLGGHTPNGAKSCEGRTLLRNVLVLEECERGDDVLAVEKRVTGGRTRGYYYHLFKGIRFGRLGFTHYKWSR